MIVLAWLMFTVIVGWGATQKGRSFWFGFLWSVILSPIVGLVIVLLSRTITAEEKSQQQRGALKNGLNI